MWGLLVLYGVLSVLQAVPSQAMIYPPLNYNMDANIPQVYPDEVELNAGRVASPLQEGHWPRVPLNIGPVAGVAVTADGNPVIFHRANITWTQRSFNNTNHYQHIAAGPIRVPTLLTLDPVTGSVLRKEGSGWFFMPHGLHIDIEGNRWVTDVALHQVFKLLPDSDTPALILGTPFQPGTDSRHFCQPTAVTTSPDGTVFVADGYCNSRVVAFSAHGEHLGDFGRNVGFDFTVPHALALQDDVLCVADRENGRLVCWNVRQRFIDSKLIDLSTFGRIFSVVIAGDLIFTVHQEMGGASALTIDLESGAVLDNWGAVEGLSQPHAIAASWDGGSLYIGETAPARVTKYLLHPSFYESPAFRSAAAPTYTELN